MERAREWLTYKRIAMKGILLSDSYIKMLIKSQYSNRTGKYSNKTSISIEITSIECKLPILLDVPTIIYPHHCAKDLATYQLKNYAF